MGEAPGRGEAGSPRERRGKDRESERKSWAPEKSADPVENFLSQRDEGPTRSRGRIATRTKIERRMDGWEGMRPDNGNTTGGEAGEEEQREINSRDTGVTKGEKERKFSR